MAPQGDEAALARLPGAWPPNGPVSSGETHTGQRAEARESGPFNSSGLAGVQMGCGVLASGCMVGTQGAQTLGCAASQSPVQPGLILLGATWAPDHVPHTQLHLAQPGTSVQTKGACVLLCGVSGRGAWKELAKCLEVSTEHPRSVCRCAAVQAQSPGTPPSQTGPREPSCLPPPQAMGPQGTVHGPSRRSSVPLLEPRGSERWAAPPPGSLGTSLCPPVCGCGWGPWGSKDQQGHAFPPARREGRAPEP